MTVIEPARRLFPRPEAAYYLGISLRGLDKLKAEGRIPPVRIGGRVVYDRVDLDNYVDRVKRGLA